MWKCVHCGLEVMFQATDPDIDGDGCYFICPGCNARNALVNMAADGDDSIVLGQPRA